ncbi:NhaP-type Na+/H+ or K+/H+ antiporter [Microbacterium resistens]|uniref:NhaP-type Na+/H+ or K+/H+ antiporter n=1 Tax=Microbacterium resistens TaxID=156977 RepID=A0ABU1S8I6_9MICO|nr:sodium:proton antiporter [Microbacterium resistens]MDR6865926.1 NhaP-type Na+/H+ or K+/H+ antiporter [Microbacterium resistens]
MSIIILVGFAAITLWSLVAHRFERSGVAGPAALAAVGALIVLVDVPGFEEAIDSSVALHVVELVLAVLLFVDACEVKGGVFGGEGRMLSRLVLIALPLSLILVVLSGLLLLPELNAAVLFVVACVIMPTDFAPAVALLRSPRIPPRVRQILNVESGYNDGLISPLFGMSLAVVVALPALAEVLEYGSTATEAEEDGLMRNIADFLIAFLGAVPATVLAIGVGAALGGVLGLLTRWAAERGYTRASGIRYVMLLTPLLAFGLATGLPAMTIPGFTANGFVAAFVAGVVFRFARTRGSEERSIAHEELMLVEEAGTLSANFVWFILGGAATSVIARGVDLRLLLIAALALTLFRVLPVLLAMLGSSVSVPDRMLIGFIGPRGTATIVFGLMAFNKLPNENGLSYQVLTVMVLTVVGSILLHGVAAPLVLRKTRFSVGGAPRRASGIVRDEV